MYVALSIQTQVRNRTPQVLVGGVERFFGNDFTPVCIEFPVFDIEPFFGPDDVQIIGIVDNQPRGITEIGR